MCGIVGYIGPKNAVPIVLTGLKRLEYRGYDSAGIAYIQNKLLRKIINFFINWEIFHNFWKKLHIIHNFCYFDSRAFLGSLPRSKY